MSDSGTQEFSLYPYPSHFTRNWSWPLMSQLSRTHSTVFFSIHHLWWWWWMGLPTGNGVLQSLEQLDYIEDWMEPRHGGRELEAVCIPANSSCHCEGSKIVMGKFLQGTCGMDITRIQVYSISNVIFQSWNLALVVVPSRVFLGLRKCRLGL